MKKSPSFRDLKTLSAYLDGELGAVARKKMEDRLARDPNLRAALDDLRATRAVLRKAPQRRAPKNFTLSPKQVAQRPPMPRLVPVLNYASALAILLFFFSLLAPSGFSAPQLNAAPPMEFAAEEPAPAEEIAPAAEEIAPAAEEVAPVAPVAVEEAPEAEETLALEEATPQADDALAATPRAADSAEDSVEKTATGQLVTAVVPTLPSGATLVATPPAAERQDSLIGKSLSLWQIVLLAVVLLAPLLAYWLRRRTLRQWLEKMNRD